MSEYEYKDKFYPRQAVTRFELNLSVKDAQRSFTVTQGDTNRRLEVTFCDSGNPFEIPDTWRIGLVGSLPNGDPLYEAGIAKDGRVIFDFVGLASLTSEQGTYLISFDMYDEAGELVSSPKVWMEVVKSARRLPVQDPETLSRLSLLQKFVEEANKIRADIEDLRSDLDDLEEDVDNLGEKVDDNTENIQKNYESIEKLKKLTATSGELKIEPSQWEDLDEFTAEILVAPEVLRNGSVMLVMPATEETKTAAEKAKLSLNVDRSGDREGNDVVVFARTESGIKPSVTMNFRYAVIHTENNAPATVTIVGGLGAGAGDVKLYVGEGPAPSEAQIWINPEAEPSGSEVWEFELESGLPTTKRVVVMD